MTTFCIAFYESYLSMLHRASPVPCCGHGLNGMNSPAESIPTEESVPKKGHPIHMKVIRYGCCP
jgi:hypothetical protein